MRRAFLHIGLIQILISIICWVDCRAQNTSELVISDELKVIHIGDSSWVHVSDIVVENYGTFPSNGLVHVVDREAIVFDTPANDKATTDLLQWLLEDLGVTIKAIVVNHFHADALGTLDAFHKHGITSYSNKLTAILAGEEGYTVPQETFDDELVLLVGSDQVVCEFPGEAHSRDNIVCWIPSKKVLFGGCMVKSLGAGKGNLGDANVDEWANTIRKVRDKFEAEIVIPGHGSFGDESLLDYTIRMFSR